MLALIENASAAQACENIAGKFVSIEGKIEFGRDGQRDRQPASLESSLCQNDMVYVGVNSRAAISLANEAVLRLDQNTTMRLVDVAAKPEKRSMLELIIGSFKSFSRPPRTFAVNTPYLNGSIEGTEFAMRVDGDSSLTTVYEGKVTTSNDQGKLTLQRGESALAKAGKAPQPYLMVKPRDAVQWTLHYPPLFAVFGGSQGQIPADASPAIKAALISVANGNGPGALEQLERIASNERDANFHLYRAALFLDVGRATEARADIDTALSKDPNASLAYALRAIIEVVGNDRQQALASAEKAVALKPSAAAKMALSYVQQASFNLEAARNILRSVVTEHPEEPLAWARLGELWLMFGDRDKAIEAARKAEALAPNLSRTQTVLGFAALAENRGSDARLAFEKAIKLASDDPLAHFGLGLTKIKSGDLLEGRRELEVSVALDSSSSLLRSYLGKAYYEEKRMPLDSQQYGIAEELDPIDPTPYLYDAIDKQTTNRPVEALNAMEKAIELNDNRAIYRSRQLLDSDLASRSASLARVYSDLGFQQRALVEGWKSVNTDPGNFSAHRLLADSYAILPRHEIARVSELLQSQLMQPLSMTPIQPHLAESNLFLIGAGGPGALSFNEFNPVFNRDGLNFQSSGLVGEKNTFAGEGVLSGIHGNAAFSMGGFHSTSDGFRQNDKFKDDIGNAFIQYEFSPKSSIQVEYRYRNINKGDPQQRFFPDNFFPNAINSDERHTYRLGGRHSFSESSTLLGSFIHQDTRFGNTNSLGLDPDVISLSAQRPENSNGFELQHLFSSDYINLTSGVGHSAISGKINTQVAYPSYWGIPTDTTVTPTDLKHTNAYAYSYLKPFNKLTFTVGVSGDFTDGKSLDIAGINQINPKFGATWEPIIGTTFRAAAFRSLKRTLITNQTLEPTQVAGFNQFYDDLNGTQAWRYGGAFDQKFTSALFGGAEISRRDLRVAEITVDPNDPAVSTATRVGWQENLARSYVFWAPQTWLALRAEYQYERIIRGQNTNLGVINMNTQRVPLGLSIFLPSGFSATLTTTYYDQSGMFAPLSGGDPAHGQDKFWLVDTGLSYRLPKRYGFVTVGASNLFDQQFNYFDTDFNNSRIHPGRMVFGKVTLALP
jgi:tetratricopeptide (TPR) repeat protein